MSERHPQLVETCGLRRCPLGVTLFIVLGLASVIPVASAQEHDSSVKVVTENQAAAKGLEGCTVGGVGLVVHLDPATGRPTSLPTPEQAAAMAALQKAQANRSSVGLVQERGPTGGMRVNLRGRFRSPVVAVRDKDGKPVVDHLHCPPQGQPVSLKPVRGDDEEG